MTKTGSGISPVNHLPGLGDLEDIWEKHLNMCEPVPSPRPPKLSQQLGKTGSDTSVEEARERKGCFYRKVNSETTSNSHFKILLRRVSPEQKITDRIPSAQNHCTGAVMVSWASKSACFGSLLDHLSSSSPRGV